MDTKQYSSQFDVMIEIIIGALNNLAKDSLCKSIIKEMDSMPVIIRVRQRKALMIGIFFSVLVFVFTIVFITTSIE